MPKVSQKNSTASILEKLGLSENEAILYSLMVRHPRGTVQELGVRTPFTRTMLYYVLNQLAQRGLVSTQDDKWRTVYIAEDPDRLYDLLSQREKEFEIQKNDIQELIPSLKNRYKLSVHRPGMRMFEGLEEFKKALEDIIVSKPDVIYSYETPGIKKPALEVREMFDRKRISKKIRIEALFFEDKASIQNLANRRYDDFTKFRSIHGGKIEPFATDLILYGGKLLYVSYDKYEVTAILIEDSALYEMQRSLFNLLWKNGSEKYQFLH